MAGLYIHIPFCRKACSYCNFHFSTRLGNKAEMVEAIIKELNLQSDFLEGEELRTVYLGGGTPSVLNSGDLHNLFEAIHQTYPLNPRAEITLEANPDDLTTAYLRELKQSPVNRLSIGVQSFRDEDLRLMNRSHNAAQAWRSIAEARDMGFENLSMDLIYAIPGQTEAVWREQLEKTLALRVPHISAYALTVEEKTLLHRQIEQGQLEYPPEEVAAHHFGILWQTLTAAGFRHYEISNFALKGREAIHNSAYWKNQAYLGVGPGAHSFKPGLRQWNVSNNILYIKAISRGELPFEREMLRAEDQYNEYVMTGLRREEGIELHTIENRFGAKLLNYLKGESAPLLAKGQLREEDNRLYIPQQQRFYSDGIASALFYI